MTRLALLFGSALSLAACSGSGGGDGSGTDTETDSGTDTDPTSTSTSTTTTGATGTSTTSTTTGDTDSGTDTSTSTGTADTGTADTSTGSSTGTGTTATTGTTSSTGTTGGGAVTYPACDNGSCATQDEQCIEESQGGNGDFCGVPCEQDSDCPDPVDGNALPECVDIPDGSPQTEDLHCVLDCIDGGQDLDCPTGMVCETIEVVDGGLTDTATCVWP